MNRAEGMRCWQAFAMDSVDSIVGPYRAAELVNEYRKKLREEDRLSDKAALAVACTAYAFGSIYVLAGVGQMWESRASAGVDEPERVRISEKLYDGQIGHCVKAVTACGVIDLIPLERLSEEYSLLSWPD
ncbi:hypothetical protein ACFYXV_26735 [Streptomyces sp. NPDC002181]|uniref:hypothetical protein n=1 Tax=unclassified Streptomyces TaxID=2593676 RepID=UPI003668B65B